MAFNYTSKFFQLTSYLLMEYRYADQPNPETYFTNTGTNTVGYDKLVNGFMSNSIQIFNPVADSTITNNTTITSVVRISETSYVTLDPNLIVPFNDFADELTNTTNLPVIFPSNLSVVYDSVRYHIRAGYNLNNIDGIIAIPNSRLSSGRPLPTGIPCKIISLASNADSFFILGFSENKILGNKFAF